MTAKPLRFFFILGENAILTQRIFAELVSGPIYFRLIWAQIYSLGYKSVPLIFVVAASVGMVMALQFGIGLEKFGGKLYIPRLVSVSIIRELGPVFTGLMFAARVGSGITAEIASMVVTQQVDAIRALGTSPIRKIVIPRVIGCLVALPLLTGFANLLGVIGGLIVGTTDLGIDPGFYWQKIKWAIGLADYFSGLGKTIFFAFFVSIPACYFGLNVKEGTKGVGQATTRTVVTSSILIFVGDYFITKLFWLIETWL